MAQVVECLPTKFTDLCTIPSLKKKKVGLKWIHLTFGKATLHILSQSTATKR
jgi:hypothetical protein